MKMRLFSALVSALVLSTATGLATITSYKIDLLTPGISYLLANQLDHVGGNSLPNLFPPGTLPDLTYILKWNCSSYDAYLYDGTQPFGPGIYWFDLAESAPLNVTGVTLNPGEGFWIVPAAPIIGLTFTGNPHPVQVPTPLPCGCGQFNFLSRQEVGTGTYENMTGLKPQNGAEYWEWNSGTQSFDVHTYTNCLWSPSVPWDDFGESAWILVPCTTNNPCPCPPEPLVLFNTGMDSNLVVLTNGAVDPHYVLTTNPNGGGSNALITDGNGLANTTNSAWITPTGNLNITNGTYVYRMTFNLPCTNDAIILGQWAVDNSGSIQLNGTTPVDTIAPNDPTSSTDWHQFVITAGLIAGQNTLDFSVANNLTSATGLRVELSGTATCCPTNSGTNCCDNCTTNNYVSYTVHIPANTNIFLVNHLCHGTNNLLSDVLPNVPIHSRVSKWDVTSQSYLFINRNAGGWAQNVTLNPGEGFVLLSPVAFDLTFSGCEPNCPPPCLPATNGLSLVGRLGIGTATWTDLFSCPPPCGARMTIWNPTNQSLTDYNYDNTHGWVPPAPVLQIGQSVFVSVQPNANCLPCTNNLVVNGGFEYPLVSSSSSFTNGTVPGWSGYVGSCGNSPTTIELWGTATSITPAEGSQDLEISADVPNEAVCQTLNNLTPGCLATVCFEFTGRPGIDASTQLPYDNNFTFALSGGAVMSVPLNPPAYNTNNPADGWQQFCTNFIPTSSTLTISFSRQPTTGDVGGAHIDNVLLVQCCPTNPCIITMTCAANSKTVSCGTNWNFDAPTNIVDNCCTNYTLTFSDATNSGPCPLVITRTWLVTDTCGNSNTCSQTVTVTSASPVITYTDLLPAGLSYGVARNPTDSQQMGYIATAVGGISHAAMWSGTAASFVDLHPSGATRSYGYSNFGSQQAGRVDFGSSYHAAIWSGSAASFVDLNPVGATDSFVQGTSGSQQAGGVIIAGVNRAAIWSGTAASFVDLHPAGAVSSVANGTTGSQQAGAAMFTAGIDHAGIWSGTAASFIDLNPAGASQSEAFGTTGSQQAGWALVGGQNHAGIWSGTAASFIDLNPAGASSSEVLAIASSVQAGYAIIGGNYHACMWSGTAASFVDLDAALSAPFGNYSFGYGIWTAGSTVWVAGGAYYHGSTFHPILWTITSDCCPTNPCVIIMTCPTNSKTVSCGMNWNFDAPTNILDPCCTNYSLTFSDVTNSSSCPFVVTRHWLVSDTCGNSNFCSQTVTVVYRTPYTFSTLAGSAGQSGTNDGTGSAARFLYPKGVAVDAAGNVYVADTDNHTVRRISSSGAVTTFAGSPGVLGSDDGTGSAARFYYPNGMAVDSAGNVYVADTVNHTIRKITSGGLVTTLAGSPGVSGSDTGTGSAARFNYPNGVAVDGAGNVYVADTVNHTVRKITSGGVVTTLAGSPGVSGSDNGTGSDARFTYPNDVASDAAGNVYVADTDNHTIRKISSGGLVTTLAGSPGVLGSDDGIGGAARFNYPRGVAVDNAGNVYVVDTGNYTIRKITSSGLVTTLAGSAGVLGSNDGTGSDARFNGPNGVAVDAAGNIYVADRVNFTIRKGVPVPVLTCATNKIISCATTLSFDLPTVVDPCCTNQLVSQFGNDVTNGTPCAQAITRTWLYVDCCGSSNFCSQTVTVINTTPPVFTNCPASTNLGCNPASIPGWDQNVRAVDSCTSLATPGYLLVSGYNSSDVRRYDATTGALIGPSGIFVSAGSGGLSAAGGVAIGPDGNLYVSSRNTSDVKRYNGTTGAFISSFASNPGLVQPTGLVFGPDGNLYVCGSSSDNVVCFNGTSGAFMNIVASGVGNPQTLVFGPDGKLYVSCFNTDNVKRYNLTTGGMEIFASGSGLDGPTGLAFGSDGNLYVCSDLTHNVKRFNGITGTDFVSPVLANNGGLTEPLGLGFGPDGSLYVCDRTTTTVKRYNGTTGAFIANFASSIPAVFLTFTPPGPAVTSTNVDTTNGCARTRTITYTALDTCGNSNTCTQVINWTVDTTPPVLTGSYAAVTLGCNPASLPTDAGVKAQVTATDNCGLAFTNVTHVDDGTLCASNRTFTITVTDACGNAAVTNVVYTWTIDHSLPVITIAPTLLNLGCNPAAASLPTDAYVTSLVRATDNCSLASTNVSHVDGGTACASNRTFTITVRDGCTNSASTNLVYTWKVDHSLPSITCLTNKITVRLNTNCQLVIPPVGVKASDNCTPASQLIFKQSPTNGTIMLAKQAYVTVTVYDACGNSNSCTALVIGQDQLGPVVSGPTTLTVTNCLMPNVTNLVTAYDNCCPQLSLKKIQSPAPNTPLGPGIYSVTVTVTDCNGNSTPWKIQLTVSPAESFLTNLFNTGVNANHALLPISAIDPHYTLGPVAAGTVTGAGNYNAPNAIVASNFWTLPPTYPSGKSAWIAPSTNKNGYPKGYYVYTNQFTLPVTADAASASISGRWAADNGAQMYFNGSATPITAITAPNGYTKWSPFTISGGFLPNLNTILFVVSNSPSGLFGSGTSITGLRVEYTNAVANCYTCAPPAIINISSPQTVPQHGGVTFYAAASGTPPLSYQWFYNGVALQDITPYSGVNSDTLFIKPVDYPLGGVYTVVITNPCGSATAKTKLSVSRGLAWASGLWNVAQLDNPLAATIGPDLNLVSTSDYGMNYTITAGTTEDFELPAPGGHVVNVMHVAPLPLDTSLQIPLIAPPGSNSVNSYSLIMDLYQPTNSAGTPSTLFQSVWACCPVGQDGEDLTVDAQNNLHVAGSIAGVPFDVASAVPLPIKAWSRVALVIDDPQDGIGINLFLYLNGQMVASLNLLTPAGLPINWNNAAPTLLSRQTNDVSLNGDFYVSSIQFHAIALAPQDIAGMGSPDAGPVPLNESVVGPQPMLAAAVVNGTISFSWTGDLFVLQETSDLTGGDWEDSMLPFTESEVNGDTMTVAHPYPQDGPAKFYRLIFRP